MEQSPMAPYSELAKAGDVGTGILTILPPALAVIAFIALSLGLAFAFRTRLTRWARSLSPTGLVPDGFSRFALLVTLYIVFTFGGLNVITALAFFAGMGLSVVFLPLSAIVAAFAVHATARAMGNAGIARRLTLQVLACIGIVSVALTWVAGSLLDPSYDGNWYHQPAVVVLAQGWNPVYDPSGATLETGWWKPFHGTDEDIAQLVVHYPKGGWIGQAAIYQITARLEQAKVANLLLMLASFAAWLALMLRLNERAWRRGLLASAIIALNPISVVQMFTFHNDGQVGSLLMTIAALAGLAFTGAPRRPVVAALVIALMMLVNLKFTGLVYAVVIVAVLCCACVLPGMRRLGSIRAVALPLALGLIASATIIGFNPYVINTLDYGHPFHPLMGPSAPAVDWIGEPTDFEGKNQLAKLGLSLFSQAADSGVVDGGSTRLKVPFSVSRDEIRPYLSFVTRVAGFGPLFGGVLLVSVALLVWLATNAHSRRDRAFMGVALIWLTALMTTVINPESWWARYVPQLWLVPTVVVAYAAIAGRSGAQRALGTLMLGLLALDLAFVGAISNANVLNADREIEAAFAQMAQWPQGAVLAEGDFGVTWIRAQERGISWRLGDRKSAPATGSITVPYGPVVAYPAE